MRKDVPLSTFNEVTESIANEDKISTNGRTMECTHNSIPRLGNKSRKMSTVSNLSRGVGEGRKQLAKKTTSLMFIVTVVFILSFVPFLVVVLLRHNIRNFVSQLSHSGRVAYRIFLRSYFLNAAVNPLIYSVYDPNFRKALSKRN